MKITDKVLGLDGQPLFEMVDNKKNFLTWRQVILVALNTVPQKPEEAMSTEQKDKAYQILKKAYDSEEPKFEVEEKAYILESISKWFSPLVLGRAREMFEGKPA